MKLSHIQLGIFLAVLLSQLNCENANEIHREANDKETEQLRNVNSTRKEIFDETPVDSLRLLSNSHKKEDRKRDGRNNAGFFYECDDDEYLDSKKNCQSCPTGCQRCSDQSTCTSCDDDFILIWGSDFGFCFPTCTSGYYIQTKYTNKKSFQSGRGLGGNDCDDPELVVSECQKCPFGCQSCQFDTTQLKPYCFSCMRGFIFNVKTGVCDVIPCNVGEYRPKPLNSSVSLDQNSTSYNDYMCQPCSNGCQNCSNGTSCNTCSATFAKFQIPKNYNSSCVQCSSFCQNCTVVDATKSNQTSCSKCVQNPRFDLYPNNSCILNRTCLAGQWFNDSSLQCQKCPDNCLSCKQGSTNGTVVCTNCTYVSVLNSTTQLCQDRCNFNTNFFSNKTLTCQECINASYPNQTAQKCVNCPNYCTNCSVNKDTQSVECTNCTNDSYIESNKKRCRTTCNATAFFSYDNSTCVNCKSSQYLFSSNETCMACPQNCSSCHFNNNTSQVECDTCNTALVIDLPTKRCRQNCSTNQIYDWTKGKCANCLSSTFFNSSTQTCDSCPYGCTNCSFNKTSSKLECSQCDTFKILNTTMKLCQDTCYYGKQWFWETLTCRYCAPYQYWFNNQCNSCPFGCPDCYQLGTNTYCTYCNSSTIYDYNVWKCKLDCKNQTIFSYTTNKCEQCPSGQYYDTSSNNCKACGTNCSQCVLKNNSLTSTNCTLCNTGYVLNTTTATCRVQCPSYQFYNWSKLQCTNCTTGSYINSTNQTCQACPSNCSACFYDFSLNKTNCTSCNTGVYDSSQQQCRVPCDTNQFYNWTTYSCQSCPSQTYLNSSQQCLACPTNCTSCQINSTGNLICNSCTSDTVLDSTYLLCKPVCSSTQQYDFNLKKCTNCLSGQYVNSAGKCTSCPGTCSSCAYISSNKSVSCYTCNDGSLFNSSRMDCGLICTDPSYYDWTSKTCKSCNSNQFLNKTSQSCANCPSQCATCAWNATTSKSSCQTCSTGYVFDSYYSDCKLQCNSTSYFDWTSRQCIQCNSKYFLNIDTQSCQQCPSGCTVCAYNTKTSAASCSSCDNGYTIDPNNMLCYQPCPVNSYYNWNSLSCQTCPSLTYANTTNNQCQNCPTNCSSCSIKLDASVKCDSCKSGYQIDSSTGLCRITCTTSSYYDSASQQCIQCGSGYWLNQTTQICQACPQGCNLCLVNSSGLPECTSCVSTLVLDTVAKRCQQQCTTGFYFDYGSFTCVACSSNCNTCQNASYCMACSSSQYSLTNGACVNKCTPTQTWNSATQTCDNPTVSTVASFKLTASATTMVRCVQYTVTPTFYFGITTSNFKSAVWSYTNSNKASGDFISQLDAQIAEANALNNMTFYLKPEFTENVTAQFSIKIQAVITASNGSTATNSTTFIIYPYRYTTLTGYQSVYTVDGAVGQNIVAQYYYPNCPIYKGPETIPSTVDIGCSLYDSAVNYIKDLSYCNLAANDATNGLTYYVKYYFQPNSYQSAVKDTITINTIVTQPTCQIASSNLITVASTGLIMLNVTVQNQQSTFVYKWNCYSMTTGASCGVVSATQNSPNLNLPASGFTANAKYSFVLSIISNSVNQTSCTAYVQVNSASSTISSSMALLLTSSAVSSVSSSQTVSASGATSTQAVSSLYLDPTISNNVACQSTKDQSSSDQITYTISIILKSTQQIIITKQATALIIPKNTLSANSYYRLQCSASSESAGTENVFSEVNTFIQLDLSIGFTVSPSSGTERTTTFSFTTSKPSSSQLWCKIGYNLSSGITFLNDPKLPAYSDSEQNLQTTLVVQKTNSQVMVAKCQNAAGQYALAYQTITINKQTSTISRLGNTNFMETNMLDDTSNIYFEQIQDSYEAYKLLNGSQISSPERIDFLNQTLQEIQLVSDNLSNLQLTSAAKLISSIWNEIKQSSDFQTFEMIGQFSNASISLLGGTLANNQVQVISQDQFLTFIGIYDEMLNDYLPTIQQSSLIDPIIDSIKAGLVRLSANIAPDSDNFTAAGSNFALQIQKQSKSKLLQMQHLSQMSMYSTAFQTQNMSLADSKDQVLVSIPFYLAMTQYDYIIMTYLLVDKQLSYKGGNQRHLSDQIEVSAYFTSSPIAITDVYDIGKINISNANQMMHITLPYKLGGGDSSAHALCSYLNESTETWTQLTCTENDEDVSKAAQTKAQICCTNHLTLFGLIYDTYYDELANIAFRQIVYSMIPPAIIYSALLVAIANSVLKYRRIRARLLQQEAKLKQGSGQVQSSSQDVESAQHHNLEDRRQQYQDRSPDPSVVNVTATDLIYDDTLQASKNLALPQAQQSNHNQSAAQSEESKPDLNQEKPKKERKCELLSVLKLSKIYVFFFVLNPDSSIFTIVFEKVILCNLFILSFTITMIIASYATELSTIILASYVILLLFFILFRQFQGVINNGTAVKDILFAFHLILLVAQSAFIAQLADNLSLQSFNYFLIASCVTLLISCTLEDMVFIPFYNKAAKVLNNKIKEITTQQDESHD